MQDEKKYQSVTFLLCVSKGVSASYLSRCLSSISSQTIDINTYTVVVVDGFIEVDLRKTLDTYKNVMQGRMRVIELKSNVGLAKALNFGLGLVHTEYVARIDPDDIAMPNRAETQRDFLNQNRSYSAVGSAVMHLDEEGRFTGCRRYPLTETKLLKYSKLRTPLAHPSVMFRKTDVLFVGGYPEFRKSQDYALWGTLLHNGYRITNLPDRLTKLTIGAGINKRRSFYHLWYEIKVVNYLKKIGFLSVKEYMLSVLARIILRSYSQFICYFKK